MGKVYAGIDATMAAWLTAQPVFFVATAPLGGDGLLNLSPKGSIGTFRVLDEHTVAYLDLTGSGIETLAHLRENGRIVLMFCAFSGRPTIVRLWGRGEAVLPSAPDFAGLVAGFPEHPGVRSVIRVAVTRIGDACGYAVPRMTLEAERDVLDLHNAKKGPAALAEYRRRKNTTSIDGLPGYPPTERPDSALNPPGPAEQPEPASNLPGPAELPAPGAELPAPGAELPAPGAELPAPGAELPAPGAELPAPGAEVPRSGALPGAVGG